jgi:hypothetical protein
MLLNDMHTDWSDADNDTRPAIATLHTAGDGFWSETAKEVRITEVRMTYIDPEEGYGLLNIYFNTDDWRPDRDGLIYTDSLFIKELRDFLTSQGYAGDDVGYSEQGMQGDNFVNLDAGKAFADSYIAKHPEQLQDLLD